MDLVIGGLSFKTGNRSKGIPMTVTLLRELPGPDRPDYWLGVLAEPVHWADDAHGSFEVTHVVLAAQWENTRIAPGVKRLPVGIAYVTDPSLLEDEQLDLAKIRYVATGVADDAVPGQAQTSPSAAVGVITRLFGKRAGK